LRVRIERYRPSRGAAALSRETGWRMLHLRNTRFRPRPDDIIVNWGRSERRFPGAYYINQPEFVANAIDKLATLRIFEAQGVPHAPYTTDPAIARGWLGDGRIVITRDLLRASAGRGITVYEPEDYDTFIHGRPSPLYVQYVKKYDEYRVHVINGRVVDVQQKRRRREHEGETTPRIRTLSTGWVYCRESVECPPVVADAATQAVTALGLTFGAADVGFTRRNGRATVYEVNTAPGLTGTTVGTYARVLRRIGPRPD